MWAEQAVFQTCQTQNIWQWAFLNPTTPCKASLPPCFPDTHYCITSSTPFDLGQIPATSDRHTYICIIVCQPLAHPTHPPCAHSTCPCVGSVIWTGGQWTWRKGQAVLIVPCLLPVPLCLPSSRPLGVAWLLLLLTQPWCGRHAAAGLWPGKACVAV